MDDVILAAYFGGLGDSLQFSTLPEEFYKQQGKKTYIQKGAIFRNSEIYDLVWKCNPYIFGVKEGERTAGDIPEIKLENITGNWISNWEYLHGLKPTNKYPKIYYTPKKLTGFSETFLVDLSSIHFTHDGNESKNPPGYKVDNVLKIYSDIKTRFPNMAFRCVKFKNKINDNSHFTIVSENNLIEVESIFNYCDLINSSFGLVSLFSGQMALSSAIKAYHPNLCSLCIASQSILDTQKKLNQFIFDNIEYLV